MTFRSKTNLSGLGWDEAWASSFAATAGRGEVLEPGRVVVAHRDAWQVMTDGGHLVAGLAGRVRSSALGASDMPAVGDWVAIEPRPTETMATIAAVLPRRSALRRAAGESGRRTGKDAQVLAANIDVVFVVAGLDHDLNFARLERYLAVAWSSGALPVMLLNKADMDAHCDEHRDTVAAIAPGVDVLVISARERLGLDEMLQRLWPGSTAVVIGSSGVGKSTLLNALLDERRQETAAVREGDSRGRHTTVTRELVPLPGGALLIDTPGLRSLPVVGAEDGLAEAFADVEALSSGCRFSDCRHDSEPGCAVVAAVGVGLVAADRLRRYHKLEREIAMVARRADPIAAREERRRWASIGKSVTVQMRHKYGDDH
ncbi:MAG TPA: ribosome small subunit-dependent GTPase A [Candidatus Limnocylindrales bacterium]|nr:ribosome small subunit-dependent GTPase A [Candidatus Limnocylindrales bacterium]